MDEQGFIFDVVDMPDMIDELNKLFGFHVLEVYKCSEVFISSNEPVGTILGRCGGNMRYSFGYKDMKDKPNYIGAEDDLIEPMYKKFYFRLDRGNWSEFIDVCNETKIAIGNEDEEKGLTISEELDKMLKNFYG